LIAASAECIETTQPAQLGAVALASLLRRFQAADGRLRVDFGAISMITNPATGERILLDHLAQLARILPVAPALAGLAGMPVVPGLPAAPGLPGVPAVVALGMSIVNGLEAEGMRYVFQAVGSPIASWEVWTSTKLKMPVLTRTIGSFGVRTCICKCSPVEPPASTFQIPSNYTVVRPPLAP